MPTMPTTVPISGSNMTEGDGKYEKEEMGKYEMGERRYEKEGERKFRVNRGRWSRN